VGGDKVDGHATELEGDRGSPGVAGTGHGGPVVLWKEIVEIPRRAIRAAIIHPEYSAVLRHSAVREGHCHVETGAVDRGCDIGSLESSTGAEKLFGEEGGIDTIVRRLEMARAVMPTIRQNVGA